jgi:DNA-binding transcriptional MerR regulator
LAEYRLEELARLSGVSARNIRAYRERGLLDPPRREGRSAFYNDAHLSQLKTINDLLHKGFHSTHVAEFFASVRSGDDLADLLGVRDALFGTHRDTAAVAVGLDLGGADVRRLCETGLADVVDGQLTFTNATVAEIVGHAADPLDYVRVMLAAHDAMVDAVDRLAAVKVAALEAATVARFGTNFRPRPEDIAKVRRVIGDYRDLGNHVVADLLDAAVQRRLVTAVSEYAASVLFSRDTEPKEP